MIEFNEK